MKRIVHFDISADDPERAVKFYTDVFGWSVQKWDGPMDYWLVTTGPKDEPGIDGGIAKRKMPIQGVGYFAMCLDTEGNPFGIMEADPEAK